MFDFDRIEKKSDSLIELLTAQCADLELLLSLARAETVAAEQQNFERILEIVSDRNRIAERLETFQQQISHLREDLAASESAKLQVKAERIVEIANLTLAQDKKTKFFLSCARDEAVTGLSNIDKSQRGANAYSNAGADKGLAYNRNF